jgi:hypothetical protein
MKGEDRVKNLGGNRRLILKLFLKMKGEVDFIYLAQAYSSEHGKEPLGFIKVGEFIFCLGDY